MKKLFFGLVATVAFSFAGNATNLVHSAKSITVEKTVSTITFTKVSNFEDCTWTIVKTKVWKQVLADGTVQWVSQAIWQCI